MRKHWILAFFTILLVTPVIASASSPIDLAPAAPGAAAAVDNPTPPSLDAFLTTLSNPAAQATPRATSCGADFCTTAQRDACNQTCLSHHHFPFVGLECCSATCTTVCICGSVPIGC